MNWVLLALDVLEQDHGFGSLPMNAAELSTRHRVPLVVRYVPKRDDRARWRRA